MKKFSLLFALLMICISRAWASTASTECMANAFVDGFYCVLKADDSNTNYFNGSDVNTATFSNGLVYKVVMNSDNSAFYLRRVLDGKYLPKFVTNNTVLAAMVENKDDAQTFVAKDCTDGGFKHVRLECSDHAGEYLNCNNAGLAAKYHNGTGGFSYWNVFDASILTIVPSTSENPIWYTINYEASNIKKYIYSDGNDVVKQSKTASSDDAYKWRMEGDTYQDFQIINHNGKHIASNTLASCNGSQLAYLVQENGETYYSHFRMGPATETFQLNNNEGVGTGIYLCAWGKDVTELKLYSTKHSTNTASFTNVSREAATITYEYIFEGNKVGESVHNTYVGEKYPDLSIPYGIIASKPEGNIEGTTTKQITCTQAEGYPFKYSSNFASATWYMLTIRSTYHPYYNSETGKFNNTGNNGAKVREDKGYFAFVGTPWGTKIINKGAGDGKAITGTPNVNNSALGIGDFADGIDFVFENNSDHFVFAAKDNKVAHINNVENNGYLGFWTAAASATDGGSTLTFEEVDMSLDAELKVALAEAKATLNSLNVPVLFSTTAVSTALAAVEAITYDATNETSIANATSTLNNIMTGLYASAEGKKFTYKSTMYNTVRYLAATAQAGALTTTEDVTKVNVFELKHVSGTNYKVQACSVDAYLNGTNTAAEGSLYNFIYQGAENFISLQFDGTGNAIHHQEYGNKPVSWDTSSDASKWYITAVTDEQWKELIWKDLENAITTAEQYSLGTGLGQYTPTSTSFIGALLDAKDMLQTHKETPAEEASIEQVQQAIASIAVSQLSINQPQPGMLLRFKGNVGGKYVSAPEAESTAKANMVEGKDDLATVFTLNEDYQLISCTTGTGFIKTGSILAPGSETAPHTFTFSEGTVIGTYVIQSNATDGGQFWYASDAVLDRYSATAHNNKNFIIEEADEYAVADMEITEVGTATFCAPFDVEIPEGVTAYTATIADDSWVKLSEAPMLIENGKLEAGTPVVLKGAPMHKTFIDVIDEDFINTDISSDGSCLTGNLKEPRFVDAGKYLLQNQTAVAGLAWYKIATSGVLKIGTNRCYMTLTSGQNAREYFPMDFDDPTGINTIATEAATKADGKYLVKGQIVVVKAGKAYTTAGQLIK